MAGSHTDEACLCAFDVVRSIRTGLMLKECFSHPTDSESDSRAGAENPLTLRWMSAIHSVFHPLSLGIWLYGYLFIVRYCLPSLQMKKYCLIFESSWSKAFGVVFFFNKFSYCWFGEKSGETIVMNVSSFSVVFSMGFFFHPLTSLETDFTVRK